MLDFHVYIIGEGTYRASIERDLLQRGLVSNVELVGVLENPYPMIRQADIYVQASDFEGYGLAAKEARILGIPLVLTDFATAGLRVVQGVNGCIVEHSAAAIVDGIRLVAESLSTYRQHAGALAALEKAVGTEELEKFVASLHEILASQEYG